MVKLLFINAGNDNKEAGNANISSFPPLGIISMATMVKEHFGDECETILIDGQIDCVDDVKRIIEYEKADAVLISMYCTGIRYAIECAKCAHDVGSLTIIGNDHAKAHYKTLLRKIPEIDIISLDEFGEFMSFFLAESLINRTSVFHIPNIAYVNENGEIITTKSICDRNRIWLKDPFKFTPLPNRALLKKDYWDEYLQNFKRVKGRIYNKNNATGVTTMNRARGCVNSRHRCSYCGIGDLSLYKSSASSFWKDIQNARREVKANYFYECFDNFTYSQKYIYELLLSRPSEMEDTNLIVYSSADRINEANCDILHGLGVYLVNLGLDAGDELGLKLLKGINTSVADNYHAVNMLTKRCFDMHISFVLMGLGSNEITRKSMDTTMGFIKYLMENTSLSILDCALFYPDKTAPVGGLIWNPDNYYLLKDKYHLSYIDTNYLDIIHNKWKDEVFIDSAEITKDFAKLCGTDYTLLLDYQQKIKEMCDEYGVSFGYSQAGKII